MKVLMLVHDGFVPDMTIDEETFDWLNCDWDTEYDVMKSLTKMGHEVLPLGVKSDLTVIRSTIEEFKPNIVFNLMEMFDGEATFDQNVVSYLQLLKIPYTGCNPRGLMLGHDKSLTKKILSYHKIKCPKFLVFPKNKKTKLPKSLEFPLIVKCLHEEASYGISQASVVHNVEKLKERVLFVHQQIGDDAIVEQFIEGGEYYCGVLGNYTFTPFPVWQLKFENAPHPEKEFYTRNAKFNQKYRENKGIKTSKAELDPALEKRIQDICKKVCKVLYLNGYTRIDLRVSTTGDIYVLEANPNPNIAENDEFAQSALYKGIDYQTLLKKILNLGLSWHKSTFTV